MKVRFLGVQKWMPEGGNISIKVFYSSMNNKNNERVVMPDGNANITYVGEKPVNLKCLESAFVELQDLKPGSVADLRLEPDPTNPRYNICTGVNQ